MPHEYCLMSTRYFCFPAEAWAAGAAWAQVVVASFIAWKVARWQIETALRVERERQGHAERLLVRDLHAGAARVLTFMQAELLFHTGPNAIERIGDHFFFRTAFDRACAAFEALPITGVPQFVSSSAMGLRARFAAFPEEHDRMRRGDVADASQLQMLTDQSGDLIEGLTRYM